MMRTRIIIQVAMALAPMLPAAVFGAETDSKEFTRFEGLNLLIKSGDAYYPMLGIDGNSAEIRAGNGLTLVPFKDIKQYRLATATEIRSRRALLEHVDVQRAYTPQNDPRAKWSSSRAALSTMRSDDMQLAEMNYLMNQTSAGASSALAGQLNSEPYLDMQNGGNVESKIQDELDKNLFDAVQFEFEVSSNKPIPHPYVIIITDIRENDSADSASRGIYIKQIDPIDATSGKVTILQGGFPRGFLLDKYQIHLYDNGSEVPTNLSENRIGMTRGEVFAYLEDKYVEAHKGQTVAATVIRGSSPVRIRTSVDQETLGRKIDVKVGKDGAVQDFSAGDAAGTLPDSVGSFLKGLRFNPALDKGVPVDSKVEASLGDLAG
jgi:hypothetical protein